MMEFGLYYDNELSMRVHANNEESAWSKVNQAGIMNKSKKFKIKRIDISKDINLKPFTNAPDNIVGDFKINKESYRLTR